MARKPRIIFPAVFVMSLVVKVGTKVRNVRLVDGDHDIDCKIAGIGAMGLTSQFIKKTGRPASLPAFLSYHNTASPFYSIMRHSPASHLTSTIQ